MTGLGLDSDRNAPRVVLASASLSRRRLLENAGVPLLAQAPGVDESQVKAALLAEGAEASQVAETLAELKARKVAAQHPGALVVGGDQMLECDGVWFDKPADREAAAMTLRALSGRQHQLISAVVVVRDEARLWHRIERARLTVRPLSEAFIASYLACAGESALDSVGAYRLEDRGAQLFSRVEGDYFTILGLPLLPLLDFLRNHGVVPT
jgi:septum formation protein